MLELYQAEGCPHSSRVRETMTNLGLSYVVHNPRLAGEGSDEITNEQTHSSLQAIGGNDQIPMLVDTDRDRTIYESEDIVAYLEDHYAEPHH